MPAISVFGIQPEVSEQERAEAMLRYNPKENDNLFTTEPVKLDCPANAIPVQTHRNEIFVRRARPLP